MTLIQLNDGPIIEVDAHDTLSFEDDKQTLTERLALAWKLARGGRLTTTVHRIEVLWVLDDLNTPIVHFNGVRLEIR